MSEAEKATDADIRRNGRQSAYDEVLSLLDAEIAKFKDRGDSAAAEVTEVLRAKVKAKSSPE